jgi:hypothetical protein
LAATPDVGGNVLAHRRHVDVGELKLEHAKRPLLEDVSIGAKRKELDEAGHVGLR